MMLEEPTGNFYPRPYGRASLRADDADDALVLGEVIDFFLQLQFFDFIVGRHSRALSQV